MHRTLNVSKVVLYHGVLGAHLILNRIRIETKDRALGAGIQEICQWTVRSWSLGDPSRKKGVGTKKKWLATLLGVSTCVFFQSVSKKIFQF